MDTIDQLQMRLAATERAIQDIGHHLTGTPGYGARHTFTCPSCNASGFIAIGITCTS